MLVPLPNECKERQLDPLQDTIHVFAGLEVILAQRDASFGEIDQRITVNPGHLSFRIAQFSICEVRILISPILTVKSGSIADPRAGDMRFDHEGMPNSRNHHMSATVYNILTTILLGASLLALLTAIAFLVGALVGWRTPFRKRRFLWCGGLFLATLGTIAAQQALLWWGFLPALGREMRQQAREQREQAVALSSLTKVGEIAPEFSVVADDGSAVESDNLRGKVVVLNFFATWCGPCLQELPHLDELWNEFGENKKFAMIAIGREETPQSVADFKSRRRLTLPMAADPDRTVYNRYATERIPRTYLIARDGTIVYQTVGFSALERPDEIQKIRELVVGELADSR